jgi:hypothetical protein
MMLKVFCVNTLTQWHNHLCGEECLRFFPVIVEEEQ